MLARTESIDAISGGRLTTSYRYHHGYWDGVDHEFRGFGRVDQTDTETIDLLEAAPPAGPDGLPQLEVPRWCPPVQTRTWFHLGPVGDATAWKEPDYSSEYWPGDPPTLTRPPAAALPRRPAAARPAGTPSAPCAAGCCAPRSTGSTAPPARTVPTRSPRTCTACPACRSAAHGRPAPQPWQLRVFFPETLAARTTQWERGSDPLTRVTFTDSYDSYGQPATQISVAVPRGRDYTAADPDPSGPYLATYAKTDYAQRDDAQVFITDRTARTTSYEAVNDGTSSLWALHAAILSETAQLSLFAQTRTYYDGAGVHRPSARPARLLRRRGPHRDPRLRRRDPRRRPTPQAAPPTTPPERPPYLPAARRQHRVDGRLPGRVPLRLPAARRILLEPGRRRPRRPPRLLRRGQPPALRLPHRPAGAEGPPGTGVGLLQVTRDPLGNDTTHRQL